MINITDKHNCCGCSACVQTCPKQCISLSEDEEGFLYPTVDYDNCIDCGQCEKVCPYLNQSEPHEPLKVLAAVNPNEEVRMQSSSGGVFSMLAESVIEEGGVVFGAGFDENWNVVHDYTETIEGLKALRGSKYVQSKIGNTFRQAREFLNSGRKVLFSGTPCQIAGLKLFLKKEYDNLLTVECVCHGVPSPQQWQQYLKEQTKIDKHTIKDIQSINFRDKISGWKNCSFSCSYNDGKRTIHLHDDNPWERAFIKNINLRQSCHNCPVKYPFSRADVALGDLWGAEKFLIDQQQNKGITLCIAYSKKGISYLNRFKWIKELVLEKVVKFNSAITNSLLDNPQRDKFFKQTNKFGFIKSVKIMTKDPFVLRMKIAIAKLLNLK